MLETLIFGIDQASAAIAIFATSLICTRGNYDKTDILLALFLTAYACVALLDGFGDWLPFLNEAIYENLQLGLTFILAPLLWFYVWHLSGQRGHDIKLIPHLLFFVFICVSLFLLEVMYSPTGSEFIILNVQDVLSLPVYERLILFTELVLLPAQVLFYLSKTIILLSNHRSYLINNHSNIERKDLRWLLHLCCGLAVFWLCFTFAGFQNNDFSELFTSALALALVWSFSLRGLRQEPTPKILATQKPKYDTSPLSDEVMEKIASALDRSMKLNKHFLDANLSLQKLSSHISTRPSYVSQVLNANMETTFFDFVNQHRIEYAKLLLKSPELTILQICYDVGFNSKSAFYKAFAKHVGETPSQYRNNIFGQPSSN